MKLLCCTIRKTVKKYWIPLLIKSTYDCCIIPSTLNNIKTLTKSALNNHATKHNFNILNPKIILNDTTKDFGIASNSVDIGKFAGKEYLKDYGFGTFSLNYEFNTKQISKDFNSNKTIYIAESKYGILGSNPLEQYVMEAKFNGNSVVVTAHR